MEQNPGGKTASYSPFLHLVILATGWRYCLDRILFSRYSHLEQSFETRGAAFGEAAQNLIVNEYMLPKLSSIVGLEAVTLYVAGMGQE